MFGHFTTLCMEGLTAFNRKLFLQSPPSYIFARTQDMPMDNNLRELISLYYQHRLKNCHVLFDFLNLFPVTSPESVIIGMKLYC